MEEKSVRFCIFCRGVVDENHEKDAWHLRREAKVKTEGNYNLKSIFILSEEGFQNLKQECGVEFKIYTEPTSVLIAFEHLGIEEVIKLHGICKEIEEYETNMKQSMEASLKEQEIDEEQRLIQESYKMLKASRKAKLLHDE